MDFLLHPATQFFLIVIVWFVIGIIFLTDKPWVKKSSIVFIIAYLLHAIVLNIYKIGIL